jgi:hypothetical protein
MSTAQELARQQLDLDRERLLELYRRGWLSASQSLEVSAMLCAEGDAIRQKEAQEARRKAEREWRERNAKARGF